MGEPIRDEQNWGMATTEKFNDLGRNLDRAFGISTKGGTNSMTDEEYRRYKESQWYYGRQSQAATLGDTVSADTENKVSRETATNLAAMVSKTSGMSYDTLNTDKGRAMIASLGLNPDEKGMQNRYDLAIGMSRMSGEQWGSDKYIDTISRVTNTVGFSNADVMKSQQTLQRMAPVQGYVDATGNKVEGLFGTDALQGFKDFAKGMPVLGALMSKLPTMLVGGATGLTPMGQTQIGRAYGGDQRTLSQLALSMSGEAPMQDWMKVIQPNINRADLGKSLTMGANGQQIGYDWGSANLLSDYASSANVAPFMSRMNTGTITGGTNMTSKFNLGGQSYDYSEVGLQLAGFDEQQRNAQFGLSQSKRSFDAGFAYTTGKEGGMGTGMGAAFTLGGPVSITIGGKTQQVTDAVSGEGISGRGQWQLEDWGRTISRMQQQSGFNFQQEGLTLSDKQFQQNFGLRQDQFNYDTQYQRQGFGIQQERIDLQYNRGKEDLAFQGAQTSLGYAWGEEDTAEALRYATGRERRSLLKKRERETVQYAMSMGRLDTQDGRLGEDKALAERDLDRGREYFEKHIEWTREEMALSLEQHNENQSLSQRQLDAAEDAARETNKLQDESTKQQRSYFTLRQGEEAIGIAHQAVMITNQAQLTLGEISLGNLQRNRQADAAAMLAKGGIFDQASTSLNTMMTALKTKADAITTELGQTIPYVDTWSGGGTYGR